MRAELVVGFPPFFESYVSTVTLEPNRIISEVEKGRLFEHLCNIWTFEPGPDPNTCYLGFNIEFQFANSLHQAMANAFFSKIVMMMSSAFIDRCKQVYGPGSRPVERLPLLKESY
eukprot:GEZU01015429.1.p1 GENE.GEZU01015429.1~~GEZU01015429.1.p1  ORF type:complete len:115 (-),score=16.25 GEZU01015429.1:88-432(-)